MSAKPAYTTYPFPANRRSALDAGRMSRGHHSIHAFLELDVSVVQQHIAAAAAQTGEKRSLTGYIIYCLAQAVAADRIVQAHRDWRGRLLVFDDVNVTMMVEVENEGRKVPMPYIVKGAQAKSWAAIHDEIRAIQASQAGSSGAGYLKWLLRLPWPLRRLIYWVGQRNPRWLGDNHSAIMVTAVGMFFGRGRGWALPATVFPLTLALGGLTTVPLVVDGAILPREVLCLTLSFDHNIIDGAPAARFTRRFKDLVEAGPV